MNVTSRTTEIQTLIADIDGVLNNKRLSKFLSSQGQQPRQVLERVRDFLASYTETDVQADRSENQQQSQRSPLLSRFLVENHHPPSSVQNETNQEGGSVNAPEAIALSAILAPLQAELQNLLQERANLVQEIRQLEQRRLQNYSLAQQMANQEQIIADFLQVLANRLGVNFQPQTSETSTTPPQQQLLAINAPSSIPSQKLNAQAVSSPPPSLLESQNQIERLTLFARELDQRLLTLDGTVNVVFEALQRNIHTYHESLSEALARMHSTGLQGEQMLANLMNNLTHQVQPQITSQEPLTIDIQKEAPSSEPSNQLESELQEEPTQADTSQETDSVGDLDAVLLQLNQDTQDDSSLELQQDSSVSIRDEVDQLYASLFNSDNLAATNSQIIPQEINFEVGDVADELFIDERAATNQQPSEFSPQEVIFEVPDVTDEFSVDATATNNPAPPEFTPHEIIFEITDFADEPSAFNIDDTSSEETADSPIVPDPWLEEGNVQAQATQDTSAVVQEQLLELWDKFTLVETDTPAVEETVNTDTPSPSVEETVNTDTPSSTVEEAINTDTPSPSVEETVNTDTPSSTVEEAINTDTPSPVVEEPVNTDTISTLEGLSVNAESSHSNSKIASFEDSTQIEIEIPNQDLNDESIDNYVPASPQENLLAEAENQNLTIPEVSLDEEQLQQLNRDLANFDGEQAAASLEHQQPVSDQLSVAPADVELVDTEEKKVTTGTEQDSLSVDDNLVNDDTENQRSPRDSVWYLGIDLGTTGISATLLNRSTNEVYPLYWSAENQPEANKALAYRLPAEVYLPPTSFHSETESEQAASDAAAKQNLFSAQLKPYLQIALPYKNERQKWEPVLQFNEVSAVPLVWVVRSLSKLLLTLKSDRNSTTLGLTAAAVGLDKEIFHSLIDNLAGVICTCPSSWSEQYRFNVREALLTSKLVQHPQQVFFVEEAIACLLSELDGANGEIVGFSGSQSSHLAKTSEHRFVGSTLVINIGASATEMALVDLPENLEELNHNDFMLHSFAYAGKGIEQDIICQLLLPTKWRQPRSQAQENGNNTITSNPWHWQPGIPGVDKMSFSSLGLEVLNLPRPGEPDISDRIRLQQRLESSLLGKAVMDSAVALKLILQHQESFTLEFADQRWILHRRDLESQVLVPFVRRLNRELNKLLVAKGIPTEAINQAILTGGTTSLGAVSRWLRQKLPNARFIQDSYLGENGTPSCSRVAYGLAMLPLHPQVLEVPRQQYTDYFLFTELLRLVPERALSFSEVIQLFEARGINTRSCQQRLLAFLEGELPAGLMPNSQDISWLSQSSRENFDYKAIAAAPLFEKQGSLTYRPNSAQLQTLVRYLNAVKASTQQSLEEPYTVNFAIGVLH